MFKNQKGITTVSLAITVVLMLMILGTITYSSTVSLNTRKVKNMYNDIMALEDKIAMYYLENGTIPVGNKIDDLTTLDSELQAILYSGTSQLNPNDGDTYYEIDTSLLSNLSLNYADDTFIINEQSHTIYYKNGITVDGEKYYTTPISYQEVNDDILK